MSLFQYFLGFKLELDVDGFDAEDIDITVEGSKLKVTGEREIQRGGSSSKRQFSQSFDLPSGIDVEGITTQLSAETGKLVISAPSLNKPEEGRLKIRSHQFQRLFSNTQT